jgi:hypothetical protein
MELTYQTLIHDTARVLPIPSLFHLALVEFLSSPAPLDINYTFPKELFFSQVSDFFKQSGRERPLKTVMRGRSDGWFYKTFYGKAYSAACCVGCRVRYQHSSLVCVVTFFKR